MLGILYKYGELLQKVDRWFTDCLGKHPNEIHCRTGCSECCRGLFDITLLDACFLKSGFDRLEPLAKDPALQKARERLAAIQTHWSDFAPPYILNYRPEEEWEILMPDDDETPCPLLGSDGRCLVYDFRPMTCRLHGLPLVDVSGEVMHDEWCTLNFTRTDPLEVLNLRWQFKELFREELLLFRRFTQYVLGHPLNEMDTFIPAALLIDFGEFKWKEWFGEYGLFNDDPSSVQ